MTINNGTAIVLAYVLASIGVIIAFLLAAFVIGWFIGRLRAAADSTEKSNLPGSHPALPTPEAKPSDLAAMSAAENLRCDLVRNAPPISSLIARDKIARFAERDLWNMGATRMALLGLDVGRPDHLTPFLGFLSRQLPEFSWRHRHELAAELGKTGLQLRVGQYRIHRLI